MGLIFHRRHMVKPGQFQTDRLAAASRTKFNRCQTHSGIIAEFLNHSTGNLLVHDFPNP
jgi:hypothetical protein